MKVRHAVVPVLLPVALVTACAGLGSPAPQPLAQATGAPLASCAALANAFGFPDTVIDSAEQQPAGALRLGDRPIPAHCLVKGRMHPRKGSDGRDYAIGFEMRLPHDWNGRFFYQGNGGVDGVVQPALGALGGGPLTGALLQRFAVISSDAGHAIAQTPFFGLEPQARLDYGWQAVAKLTPMAKSLIRQAYGKAPDRSYIGGCSNGGRHAMVAAARLPEQYDGYLVGAPGYLLPRAALAQLWGVQQWTPLATPGATARHPLNPNATIPDLGTALTAQERRVVADAVLARCDALDGVRDGLVQATAACQAAFDPQRDIPACSTGRNGSCLSAEQKRVLAAVHAGARTADGRRIYAGFAWDAGISAANWATWKFVNSAALDPLSVGTIFTAPPAAPIDPVKADLSMLLSRFDATDGSFRESGMSLMTPPGHEDPRNMDAVRARGAKIVMYHGVSDAIFSAEDTRQWLSRVDRATGGRADSFARLFPVPGMSHCSGGPATDQFDLLGPLVRWVEEGVAPQAVPARARGAGNPGGVNAELPADWAAARTRPLCAVPTVATWVGGGSVDEARSFACR